MESGVINDARKEGRRMTRAIKVDSKLCSKTVRSQIRVSSDLEKYFTCYEFFSSFDHEIAADESILNIPVLSIVLPLAWITGSDVYVDILDRRFAESMPSLQNEYKRMYPKAPFKTNLIVNKFSENKDAPQATALLFSGGLDATYSLFSHMALDPRLIMILGTDMPLSNTRYLDLVKTEYSDFAERSGLTINFIRTNAFEILNRRRVDHLFWKYKERLEGDCWKGIGYALGHIGQAAPLSIGGFDRLLIAAWANQMIAHAAKEFPDASSPGVDEHIAWADLKVRHDGCLNRHEKALAMKEFLSKYRTKLRVCWDQPLEIKNPHKLNCGRCEKCLRTIASLALAGIDPKEHGFPIDDKTSYLMQKLFKKKKLTRKAIALWWKPLQPLIPDQIEGDLFGLKAFFEWFKDKNLGLMSKPFYPPLSLVGLYFIFPYMISNLIRNIFYYPFEKDERNRPARKQRHTESSDGPCD